MKSINSTLRMKNLQSSMTRIILFGLFILKTVAASKDNDSPANSGNSGRYTVKEEVQKAPEVNHFCNLTRTSVKISFPEMKSRVFVNFLGYKEPNLIHLQRCKGRCGDTESSSCVPIRYQILTFPPLLYIAAPGLISTNKHFELLSSFAFNMISTLHIVKL